MRICRMLKGITVTVAAKDRARLEAIVADRNSPQKHVWRARIILLTADGCGTAEIMRGSDTSKTAVWRWQERFMIEGVAGLLRNKTRLPRIAPLGPDVEAKVVKATVSEWPPGVSFRVELTRLGDDVTQVLEKVPLGSR